MKEGVILYSNKYNYFAKNAWFSLNINKNQYFTYNYQLLKNISVLYVRLKI